MIDGLPTGTTSILIVTYNSASVIVKCLDALISDQHSQIVVVDNNSQDESVALCRAHSTSPLVIESDENTGFARAVNLAAAQATGEYLLLLNPDAVVSHKTVVELSDRMHRAPSLGVIAPRVMEREADRTVAAGFAPTIPRMLLHLSGISRCGRSFKALRGHYLLADQLSGPTDVDWVTGACMMTRRTTWDQLDGLSTRWFMYAEDIDYCLRARDLGYTVSLEPDLIATHAAGKSSDDLDQRIKTEWLENLYDLYTHRYQPNALRRLTWRSQASVGFAARSAFASTEYDRKRFRTYAQALMPRRGIPATKPGDHK